ncbi:hypothetical protein KKA15_02650 [Patescibacteria group bacterium]|nr:hypothetical protein [Patescibacteria group bacterium]
MGTEQVVTCQPLPTSYVGHGMKTLKAQMALIKEAVEQQNKGIRGCQFEGVAVLQVSIDGNCPNPDCGSSNINSHKAPAEFGLDARRCKCNDCRTVFNF